MFLNSWLVNFIMLNWIGDIINLSWINKVAELQRSLHHGLCIGSYLSLLEFRLHCKCQARMAHQVLEGFYLNGEIIYINDTVSNGSGEWLS